MNYKLLLSILTPVLFIIQKFNPRYVARFGAKLASLDFSYSSDGWFTYCCAMMEHETGGFSFKNAPTYLKANNCIGMNHPSVRETTSISSYSTIAPEDTTTRNIAVYSTFAHSAYDFFLWLKYNKAQPLSITGFGVPPSESIYKGALFCHSRGYFTDTILNYSNGAISLAKKYPIKDISPIFSLPIYYTTAFFGFVVYLFYLAFDD